MPLIEELFRTGVMTMGPSRADPGRRVGVFRQEAVAQLPAMRAAEMRKFGWLAGEWNYENRVPATPVSPAYVDVGSARFARCEKDGWICAVAADGSMSRHITFDPFSRQWIYVLTQGSYGILRSADGWRQDRIVFRGSMIMIGIECEWRMSWHKVSDDEFQFVNEDLNSLGVWEYIDEWRFTRKPRGLA